MLRIAPTAAAAAILIATQACQPADQGIAPTESSPSATADVAAAASPSAPTATTAEGGAPFAAITADETIRLIGTEPFWGGTVRAGELVYSTPENQAGETIVVRRFAGNNGLGFSGSLNGDLLDLTVTPGECSDGMSDRTYPFAATLKLAEEQRNGCAWTERMPFSGPANP